MADHPSSSPPIDAPPPDLTNERDELLSNFTKGSQLTREFLEAYDQMQTQVAALRAENAKLRAALDADSAMEELMVKIARLETEKKRLLVEANESAEGPAGYPSRAELEAELADFANLQVASNWLHSTLSPRGVARRIREILEQLVGVGAYVIYLCNPEATPIASEGLRSDESAEDTPPERLADVVNSGVSSILDSGDPSDGTAQNPAALIPLSIDDKVVGVLSIVRSLTHKRQLNTVDYELFKLLGQHAAAALMASGLYAQAGRTLPSSQAFISLQH